MIRRMTSMRPRHAGRGLRGHASHGRGGMSLLELMLALAVTAMVATAISGMLHAMTTGVVTRRDSRGVMVRATTAQTRLAAYISPARCVLDSSNGDAVVWFDDSRQSDTVHASEIRWIIFDDASDGIDVWFVNFPDTWTETEQTLADLEFAKNSDWSIVLAAFTAAGQIGSMRLVDGLSDASIILDAVDPHDTRVVSYDLDFTVDGGSQRVRMAAEVVLHHVPVR